MKVAALLNVHADPDLVLDTVDSVRAHMTEDVLVLVDGGSWDRFRNVRMPCHKMAGLYHQYERAPYRNLVFGMMTLTGQFPDADWYCYIEYDCLVAGGGFKEDLEAAPPGVWCLGNDYRVGNHRLPHLEVALGGPVRETHCLLGCCTFFRREFMEKIKEEDFFRRFLHLTNDFSRGYFPGFGDSEGYDFGEHLFPTVAAFFGGETRQLATYYGGDVWVGDYRRYPMRFRPEYDMKTEKFPDASIIHPVKSFDHPFRTVQRMKRRMEETKCESSSPPSRSARDRPGGPSLMLSSPSTGSTIKSTAF